MIARGGADALQAEKDLRGAVKRSSNAIKKCNWWDATASPPCYCDLAAGYSADKTTGLFRCKKHGGNEEQLEKSCHGRSCCKWGTCTNFGGTAHKNGYCRTHFDAVTEKAKEALAETEPGAAYDAAAHFALGDARVQADPATKRVPGKKFKRSAPSSAGSSTNLSLIHI